MGGKRMNYAFVASKLWRGRGETSVHGLPDNKGEYRVPLTWTRGRGEDSNLTKCLNDKGVVGSVYGRAGSGWRREDSEKLN